MKNNNKGIYQNKVHKLYRKVFDYFLQGLLFVAPIALTVYVIVVVFRFIDNIAQVYLDRLLPFHIPGVGILLMFLLITFVGFVGHRIISQPVKLVIEKAISKAPIIEVVYTSVRDLVSAFVGKEKKFNQPVLVKVSKTIELEKIGFITATDLEILGLKDKVAVYFPHSYNFSGELFIVPTELVKPLDINPSEAMKFIVSGGVSRLTDINNNSE